MSLAGRELLTTELRELGRLVVAGRHDDAVAAAAARELARVRTQLVAADGSTPWWWETGDEAIGGWERFNPWAPPLVLSFDGEAVRGRVTLGVEFTGPPRVVHGGYVATVLDHALGIYLSRIGRPSLTARLTVRYLAPTPLGSELEIVASHETIEGPRTRAWAELRHEGQTTARAEASFRLVARASSAKDGSS